MTALRLIQPDGQPDLTRDQARFLKQCEQHFKRLGLAEGLLLDAVASDKPFAAAAAVRSLLAIALALRDSANEAGC